MKVTLRPSYCARYVRLEARLAFPSGVLIVAIDDNGTVHNVDAPPFATFADADAAIAAQPARIWATPVSRGFVVASRGSARVSYGQAR